MVEIGFRETELSQHQKSHTNDQRNVDFLKGSAYPASSSACINILKLTNREFMRIMKTIIAVFANVDAQKEGSSSAIVDWRGWPSDF